MFTVIFVNHRAEQQRKNYQFLFQPFIDAGEMCFCPWLPEETSIEKAVPDLYRLLKGKKEWRAIVLQMDSVYENRVRKDVREEEEEGRGRTEKYRASDINPFDYSDVDNEKMPHDSEIPLIRLTHMLAGYEFSPIKKFETIYDYYNDELDEERSIPEKSINGYKQIQKQMDDIRVRYIPNKDGGDERIPCDVDEEYLDLSYLFASYGDETEGKNVRISVELILKLIQYQNDISQNDSRYLYVRKSEKKNALAEPEVLPKDKLFKSCQYLGDDCKLSVFQQECIEYFILHKIEYQLIYRGREVEVPVELPEESVFVEYVDERLKKTCRVQLTDWFKTERLFKIKSKESLGLIYCDGTRERELERTSVFIENGGVRAVRPIRISVDELENYHKFEAAGDESSIQYFRQEEDGDQKQWEALDKHALLMECVENGIPVGMRISVSGIDMFHVLQNHKHELSFMYLPKAVRHGEAPKGHRSCESANNVQNCADDADVKKSLFKLQSLDVDEDDDERVQINRASETLCISDSDAPDMREYKELDSACLYVELAAEDEGDVVSVSMPELIEIEDVVYRKDELKLNYRAVFHDETEIEKQKELNRKYRLADNRPLELILFATRARAEKDEKQSLRRAWAGVSDVEMAQFWETNHYPVNCRFLYMDIMSSDNFRIEQDLLSYWVGVLLMARNSQGAGCLKAYNLYRMRVELNEKELMYALNRQLNQLDAAYMELQGQLQCAEEYTYQMNDKLFTSEEITVNFTQDKMSEMVQNNKMNYLCEGDREEEERKAREKDRKIEKEKQLTTKIGNKQQILDEAVKQVRKKSFEFVDYYSQKNFLLNDYQIKELEAQKIDFERKLINERAYSPEEFEVIQKKIKAESDKKMAEANKAKEAKDKTRMTFDVVKTVCYVAIGLIVVGNGTYMVQAAMQGESASERLYYLAISMGVTLIILAAAAGCAYFVYRQYCKEFDVSHVEYERVMRSVDKLDRPYEETYGNFYSNLLTYMRLQAMFSGIGHRKEKDIASRRKLLDYSRAIQRTRERDEKWLRLFGLERIKLETNELKKLYDHEFMDKPMEDPLFYFVRNDEDDEVRLNETDRMAAVYPFVNHVWIERDYLTDEAEEM